MLKARVAPSWPILFGLSFRAPQNDMRRIHPRENCLTNAPGLCFSILKSLLGSFSSEIRL